MECSVTSIQPSLWRNIPFVRLYCAQIVSLVGSGLSSVALGLLAHQLVGASASAVLGITLTIRIVMIVTCAPWAGHVADRLGERTTMILCDLMRAVVVIGFFFVETVWHIYLLAVLLNFGAALFTPVFKAVVPSVTTAEQYPRALALSSVAYDTANILGPSLAGLTIALVGFRGNFIIDALTFLTSASLIFGLPRLAASAVKEKPRTSATHGVKAMFQRWQLRESLNLALQVSVAGGFILVATVDFIKTQLNLSDASYAWAMAAYGIGSVLGATLYAKLPLGGRNLLANAAAPAMLLALLGAGFWHRFEPLLVAWAFAGAGQSTLGIRGNELLAANSDLDERPHVYAAHFSLSHAGWGLTYPLAGFSVTALGFETSTYMFAGFLFLVSLPIWIGKLRLTIAHIGLPDRDHHHSHSAFDPPGIYHVHEHSHGSEVHSHPHRHGNTDSLRH
jgi:NRE family putative nickel resistance protein-like MFS transporter